MRITGEYAKNLQNCKKICRLEKLFVYLAKVLKLKKMIMKRNNAGMGLIDTLLVLFIVLKLTGNITWSWLWVLSPDWILWGLYIIAVGVSAIMTIIENKKRYGKENKF